MKYAIIALAMVLSMGTMVAQRTQGKPIRGASAVTAGTQATDPGPRGGTTTVGGSIPTLTQDEQILFSTGLATFNTIDSVGGRIPGEPDAGLGPTFNGNSCAMCHAYPAPGGTSPKANPQIALSTLDGAMNTVPSFIDMNSPVREARFIKKADGTPDGGVHGLFTIMGREDAPGCMLQQPDFATQVAANNVIFRIPTPTFGLGLVEATPDYILQANLLNHTDRKKALGISGILNTSGNDGTVTRFGWKAQNKSLVIFAGEAYNVEQGVTNENFPNERALTQDCDYNGLEDATKLNDASADVPNFAAFMRLSAAPVPVLSDGVTQTSADAGKRVFYELGCALCHSPTLTTGNSPFTGVANIEYHPFSDFAIHHMGTGLADNISQGGAGGDQFRSAPLWGLGPRLFFMHDGRSTDLLDAIKQHSSSGSEANQVINNFNALSPTDAQNLLNFLRSL